MPDPFEGLEPGNEADEFEVDLDREEDELPKAGQYVLRLVDVQKDVSKAGNPMWVFDWDIVGDAAGDTTFAGERYKSFCALTSAALWKLEETLLAIGAIESPGQKAKFKRADVIDTLVLGHLVEGEYNGRPQMQLDAVGPHPKGAIKANPAAVGGAAPPAPAPAGDDIPF